MTARLTPAIAAQIRAQVDAIPADQRTRRALDAIASQHGLMLDELTAVLRSRPQIPQIKSCSLCGEDKPLDDFYTASNTISGRASQCIKCTNSRPPTPSKIVRNRARNRAYQVLANAHPDEFKVIMARELQAAEAEHARLQQVAVGRPDAAIARLKPGPKRTGETSAIERLDVARCPSCHTHHDAEHQCPSCGDTTPETKPVVRAFEVRAWALENGMEVPSRGPVPRAVFDAFHEAHPQEAS